MCGGEQGKYSNCSWEDFKFCIFSEEMVKIIQKNHQRGKQDTYSTLQPWERATVSSGEIQFLQRKEVKTTLKEDDENIGDFADG